MMESIHGITGNLAEHTHFFYILTDLICLVCSWELSNGIKNDVTGQILRQGEADESIAVRGTFSHIGPDGRTYIVEYVADDNGYQTRAHQ